MSDQAAPSVPHDHDHHPPRALLMACAALVVFALLGVSVVRLTGSAHTSDWRPLTVDTLSFRFADGEGGEILALDADTGAVVHTWAPETGGFVRTSLRSLALDRAQNGLGAGPPFSLHLTGNGRFILEDPATGQWVSLDAFGKDNAAEFERLFAEGESRAMSPRKLTVPCTLRIEHTFDSLEAHVELDGGVQPGIGDRVFVHGAPVSVPFGERLVLRRVATLTRANFIERALTRLHAMFLLTELYEVSFSDGRV